MTTEAAPSINYYDMLSSLCKISMLCCVDFFQFVISASKFSRSPYLDNHLSESTHTWAIDTLYDWLSFHDIGLQVPCPGVGLDVNI